MKRWTIRTQFAPPVFPGDEARTRRAILLNSALLTCAVLALCLIAGNLAGGTVPVAVTGLDFVLFAACLVLRRWAYQGRIGLASGALLAIGLVGITLAVALLGTIRTPTTAVYMLLILATGLLFDLGSMIAMTVLCALALAGLIVAENAGLLPRPDTTVTITQWVTYTVLFAWAGSMTLASLQSTRRALMRAEQEIAERKEAEEALRQARDQFQAVLDVTPAAISWIGADLRYRGINRYLAESLGRPDTAVAGEPIGFLGTSPELADFARDFFAHKLLEDVREVVTKNGAVSRSYLIVARKYQAGQAAVLVGVDITERKQAEEALRESRAMLKQILDTVPQAVFWKDKASVYRGCNQAFARAVGLSDTEQVVGKTDFDLAWPREEAEVYRADDAQVVTSGIPKQHIVEPLQQADGSRLWIDTFKLPLFDTQREVQGVLGIYEDITERKRAEEALRAYAEQLRELTARLANAEEDERRRIAQELHDRVGQNLTALSINLNIVANLLPPESAVKIGPRLADSLELVSETVEHIRDVMAELRPPVLDDYGLLAALRWYGQRLAQRTGLAITTQGADPTPRLPLATEMTLFRIAQEALTNAARHAQARQVTITLAALAAGVCLSIADDGTGFDPDLRTQPNGRRTLGLLTMAERAESIGGRLVIDAASGHGTRVMIEIGQVL